MHDSPAPDPETVRQALIDAALAAYEDAALSGLCPEGRWEAAVGAMRTLDLGLLERRDLGSHMVHRTPDRRSVR
jgi:hypothetical protein